jgi:predicted CoA-binding protein
MKANLTQINEFLDNKAMAFVGASRNEKKFGTQVFIHQQKLGYILYPVHPEAAEIQGVTCVNHISDLPVKVKSICLFTHKQATDSIVEESLKHGITQIWVQQFSETEKTSQLVQNFLQANIVTGRCVFMYTESSGMHNFHRKVNKMFGTIAK